MLFILIDSILHQLDLSIFSSNHFLQIFDDIDQLLYSFVFLIGIHERSKLTDYHMGGLTARCGLVVHKIQNQYMQREESPKTLDPQFLYGEKKYQSRLKSQNSHPSMPSDMTASLEEVLQSVQLKGPEKVERILKDEQLYKDFTKGIYKKNPDLQEYAFLPLLQIYTTPQEPLNSRDIETLLLPFGQVSKIINREHQVYVLMGGVVEAWLAAKMLNNTPVGDKHKLNMELCFEDGRSHHIYRFPHRDHDENTFVLDVSEDNDDWLYKIGRSYKFVSIFELEVDNYSEQFHIKERIMGVKACNIVRIFYLVEKAHLFGQDLESNFDFQQLDIKLVVNKKLNRENQVAIMSNMWQKFVLAQRYTNELFAQIKEEFKFYQDYQLHSLAESRVKRMDKFFDKLELTFHYDNDQ